MDNKSEQPKKIGATRRGFLKKSTAGVVIASIPARSVWGACTVSGALSGNASRMNDDCYNQPNLSGGRSPGGWQAAIDGKNLHGMFSYIGFLHEGGNGCSDTTLTTVKGLLTTQINQEIETVIQLGGGLSFKIKDALNNSGGILYNLAAVYLNIKFLFYSVPSMTMTGDAVLTAEDLIRHMYALHISETNGIELEDDHDFGFTDGISHYNPVTKALGNPALYSC